MTDPNTVMSRNSLTLHGKKWFYRDEGNANVVLAVPEDGIVVRVLKDDGSGGHSGDKTRRLWIRVAYYDAVQQLFFSSEYVDLPVPKNMSAKELCEINRRIRRDRPPNRTHKNLGSGNVVTVCPDYTMMVWPPLQTGGGQAPHVYCAEIKPKQGWLYEADLTTTRCTFCAHQYLKLSRGDVLEISWYCPLDLFSGRHERVERAIHGLLQSPQNNLKMFRDGVRLDADDLARTAKEALGDRFCTFVAGALLGDFSDCDTTTAVTASEHQRLHDDGVARQPCDFDAVPMPQHCVLHKVLTMQKIQYTNFETVLSAYKQLMEQSASKTFERQFKHVFRLVDSMNCAKTFTASPLEAYLIAATAQDCSVYVTFLQKADGSVLFDGRQYAVSVKVSDLDPKPLSTVYKHHMRNTEALLACKRYLQD